MPGATLFLDGEERARRITAAEASPRAAVIEIEGVADRGAAEALIGRYLEVEPDLLPPDTYYWHELIGISVRDDRGRLLGEIAEVFRAGENEVYRIVGEAGETLVPALRDVVAKLDVAGRSMVVRLESEEVR